MEQYMTDYEDKVIADAHYINNTYPLLELQSSVGRVFSILSKYMEDTGEALHEAIHTSLVEPDHYLRAELTKELSVTLKHLTMLCYELGLSLEDITNEI
jgi:phosphoribosyl-ATP pyrophosphohydrolase